jgi:glycogen operon protein
VRFKLPEVAGGAQWELLVDTNLPDQNGPNPFDFGHEYEVTARSLLLFALRPETSGGGIRRAREALSKVTTQPAPVPARRREPRRRAEEAEEVAPNEERETEPTH